MTFFSVHRSTLTISRLTLTRNTVLSTVEFLMIRYTIDFYSCIIWLLLYIAECECYFLPPQRWSLFLRLSPRSFPFTRGSKAHQQGKKTGVISNGRLVVHCSPIILLIQCGAGWAQPWRFDRQGTLHPARLSCCPGLIYYN